MKGKATVTEATEVGVFKRIQQAFAGEAAITVLPRHLVNEGETVVGVLTDPTTQALYSQMAETDRQIREESAKHLELHTTRKVTEAECEASHRKTERLQRGSRLLSKLFWAGVRSSLPIKHRGCRVRQGWKIVSTRPEENGGELFSKEHISSTLFRTIGEALRVSDEKGLPFGCPNFLPINAEKEEYIIGVVTSPAVKAVCSISTALDAELETLAKNLLTVSPSDVGKSQLDLLTQGKQKFDHLSDQKDLVMDLFWLGGEGDGTGRGTTRRHCHSKGLEGC